MAVLLNNRDEVVSVDKKKSDNKKTAERNYECGGTLCWKCKNAVPSKDGTVGCSWMIDLIPVKGWDARQSERTKIIYGVWDSETNEWFIDRITEKPQRFHSYKNAKEKKDALDISHNAYRRFKVKILKRTKVNSYYVYKCPEFIRG